MTAGTIPANIYPLLFLFPFKYSVINMCFHKYVWMLASQCLVSEVISRVRRRAQGPSIESTRGFFQTTPDCVSFFPSSNCVTLTRTTKCSVWFITVAAVCRTRLKPVQAHFHVSCWHEPKPTKVWEVGNQSKRKQCVIFSKGRFVV